MKPSNSTSSSSPRVLFLDIETAPLQSYHWGLWDENIGLEQIKDEWTILAFAAKWADSSGVEYQDTSGRGVGKVRDDGALLERLWALLDEADIVVAQNGQAFDVKKINARLLMRGFTPYSPIRIVDTMLVSKRHFGFTSNKLAWLGKNLTNSPKSDHRKFPGFELWSECLKDNKAAWAEMKKYNTQDVVALENLYLVLRPWIEGHPNVAAYASGEAVACPKCGSADVQKRGKSYTQTGEYHRFQCKACGGWARSRYTTNTGTKRKSLLSN